MSAALPNAYERAWRSSDVFVGHAVRFYAEDGVPWCDVANPETGLWAPRCQVALGGLRSLRVAPGWERGQRIDPRLHPPVLLARLPDDKPAVVFAVLQSPRVPSTDGEVQHESEADFDNAPGVRDDILSDNGGTRFYQRADGKVCLVSAKDVSMQLNGAALVIGETSADDNAAIAGPSIDILQKILDRLLVIEAKQAEILGALAQAQVQIAALSLPSVWVPEPVFPISTPPVTYDLEKLRSRVLKISSEADDG